MSGESQKSWLARPEGKFGTAITIAVVACVAGLVIYAWGTILPWVIRMLENTLTAVALAAILAVIGVVLFDPRWRNLLNYGYKSAMRGLTSLFIEIDPIGILKTYVEKLEDRLADMDRSIENLGGQKKKLAKQISDNEAERQHSLALMQQAQKKGGDAKNVFMLQARQAGRLEKSNLTLQNLLNSMEKLYGTLRQMRGAAGVMVEDIRGEVDVRTKERAALLAGYNAFSKAKRIMQGGDDERVIFDMTMEKLADDYGMKMGEIETFMEVSKGFIDGVDLENGIYEADALAQLEAWEQKSQNILLGVPSTNLRVEAPAPLRVDPPPAADAGSFDDLFQEPTDKSGKHQ